VADHYYNDFITWGWGDPISDKRRSKNEKMIYKFSQCTKQPMNWRKECVRAADLMYQSTDKKLLVHFSGGIDSEIICRSLMICNHPFEVSICRFPNDLNKHDIDYAIKFCKYFDIKYSFIELDIVEFLESDCYPYRNVEFANPFWQCNMHKYMLDRGYGYQIIGDGHVVLVHDPHNYKGQAEKTPFHFPGAPITPWAWDTNRRLDDNVYLVIFEGYIEVSSYMNHNNIDGTYLFYCYTPELYYSYLIDSYILEWLKYCQLDHFPDYINYPYAGEILTSKEYMKVAHLSGGNNSMKFKKNIKHKFWPELESRPKYAGLEKLQPMIRKYIVDMSIKQPFDSPGNNVVTMTYNNVVRQLKGDLDVECYLSPILL